MSTLRRAALVLILPALLAACSASVPGTAGKTPARPASSASGLTASPAAGPAVTSAPSSSSFACSNQLSGGTPSLVQLTDVRVASHPGFDRITFQFAGAGSYPATGRAAVPVYKLAMLPSPNFVRDPSGLGLQLAGSAGLRVVFQGASDYDSTMSDAPRTYKGSLDIHAGLPAVREVAQVGDFERVLSWGAGLASSPCLRTTELSNPSRLVIDVRS